ncbi:MAG: hypothetical protein ACOC97_00995 [Myxococcota bacterium]
MSRLLPLLLALLVGGCGASGPPPQNEPSPASRSPQAAEVAPENGRGRQREPTERERTTIRELETITQKSRELTFARPVPVQIQDQVRISAHLSSMIEEEDLDEARVVYSALGLIDPETDLRALIERLASEQVVGYYDPKKSRLVVRDDVMKNGADAGDEAAAVLVHELVHALQDQRLGLGETYDLERDTDAQNAFDAVVEGDATLAMLGHVLSQQGAPLDLVTRKPVLLGQVLDQAPLHGMELESAPPIVRVTLVAPYIKGLLLVATLHGRGGWEAVNEAHAEPPVSTEQVLHPEKYLAGEAPEPVELPELAELREAGLEPFEEDTLGELEIGVYFAQHRAELDSDAPAAAGWAGDRLRVYQAEDGSTAVVWFTLWDDEREAREAMDAAQAVRDAAPKAERVRHVVERRGRAVLVVRGLSRELHPAVHRAFRTFAGSL